MAQNKVTSIKIADVPAFIEDRVSIRFETGRRPGRSPARRSADACSSKRNHSIR